MDPVRAFGAFHAFSGGCCDLGVAVNARHSDEKALVTKENSPDSSLPNHLAVKKRQKNGSHQMFHQ
jgi:hypothetical protein